MTVISPHLAAAGAAWADGPDAGRWIAQRLGPFGPSVGHAVPLGYAAYAMVTLDALVARLEPFTAQQPVHSAIWDGWPIWRSPGTVTGPATAGLVEEPDTRPLQLPHRCYRVWSGPLRSVLALRHQGFAPPSLIWPQDRSWFVGAPIYTDELAVAGPDALVDAVIADARLDARRATPDDILRGDD